MEREFWLERWQQHQIGFHEGATNTLLAAHSARLGAAGRRVFVPLSGKTRDMAYLASLGHEVVAVELASIAAEEFFAESGVTPERVKRGPFEAFSAGAITILVGDYFDTSRDTLGAVDAVYDRAALVALPPEMQQRYASHLVSLVPAGAPILLVTFDYDTSKMQGPPFAIPEARVHELFDPRCDIEKLETRVVKERPKFEAASATESAWLLTVRA